MKYLTVTTFNDDRWKMSIFSGGDSALANCEDCSPDYPGNMTMPVGSYIFSPHNLHDILGNVGEWVEGAAGISCGGSWRDRNFAVGRDEGATREHEYRRDNYTGFRIFVDINGKD